MQPNQSNKNPYASAAGAYGNNAQKHAGDPRELEARVLLKSAQFLSDLQGDWGAQSSEDLASILKYNRSIWLMFYDTALENADGLYPQDLRNNITNLANFVFKREIEILAKPAKEKLDILININRNIAQGLMKGAAANPLPSIKADDQTPPPSSGGGTDTSA